MKVAIVHYWLTGMRGGEKVVEALCELYPQADIFTLVADPERLSETIRRHKIQTSFLQKIGGVRHYKKMLALMPFALEAFDLTPYDLVISSEAGPAKGVVTRPDALHVCYCHSPMRYVWDLYPEYRRSAGALERAAMSIISPLVRQWDVSTAARVDHFVANSAYVALRIEKYYRRTATVINPPVDVSRFRPAVVTGDYYLCAGQVTPYKRVDLAVDAFTLSGRPLHVIGDGVPNSLRHRAGPNVTFLGAVDQDRLAKEFAECRALIFPGIEDFGITPVEVLASGKPVIAYGRGGVLESVEDGRSGVLFDEQSTESLTSAVERFEAGGVTGTPSELRASAARFDRELFKLRFATHIASLLGGLPTAALRGTEAAA